MIRTITFLEKDYNKLQKHLFKNNSEQAAFLLCSPSVTDNELRLLVNEVIPVEDEHIILSNPERIQYKFEAYNPVINKAQLVGKCFMMVHSHINGYVGFSSLDDSEEIKLLKYAYNRISDKYHGSIVFNDEKTFVGRIFNNTTQEYESIIKLRVLGDIYKIINAADNEVKEINNKDIYNRNILAFGEDLQKVLQNLNVGVVGCGGTGSAVIEQLCRLGVGKLTLIDGDTIESTNITRIHGSKISDEGLPKVMLMKNMIDSIGLGTEVIPLEEKLDNEETAKKLRDCDIIFSCLDYTHFARSIINQLSIFYFIPIIDTGIKFDSRDGVLYEIFGRIDEVTPAVNCLFCRGVINSKMIASELMNEEDFQRLKQEGYAVEIKNDKVQAMPYNTLIGSYAVIEMIQLLTNFKGMTDFSTTYRFNSNKTSTNGVNVYENDKGCICTDNDKIGKGDCTPFLSILW